MSLTITEAYAPRPTLFLGLLEHAGWRTRSWFIRHPEVEADMDRFSVAVEMASATLPQPPRTDDRPGVAVLIAHQGRTVDYVVLGWWDRENELPLKVWVDEGLGWREARGSESLCVWDLEVIARERDLYVRHVLADAAGDVDAYALSV